MNAETVKTITEIMVNLAEFCAKAGEAAIAGLIIWWGLNYVRPVVKRLGMGLKKRKIYIFSDEFGVFQNLLDGSGLFRKDNIKHIPGGALEGLDSHVSGYLDDKSLIIFHYKKDTAGMDAKLEKVLDHADDNAGLIIYSKGSRDLRDDLYEKAGKRPNTVTVNAKGRMLNDVLNLMMTTDFQKKGVWATLLDG